LTDGQTDGQTDRIPIAIPRLHFMQRGKKRTHTAVQTQTQAQLSIPALCIFVYICVFSVYFLVPTVY